MQDITYQSRGDITFCFEKSPMIGHGVAILTIATPEISTGTFKEPDAHVSGLQGTYGVIVLKSQDDAEVIANLLRCFHSQSEFSFMGIFLKGSSKAPVALLIVGATPSNVSLKNGDATVSILKAVLSEYAVSDVDFSSCPE
jgi:hypothetical protein